MIICYSWRTGKSPFWKKVFTIELFLGHNVSRFDIFWCGRITRKRWSLQYTLTHGSSWQIRDRRPRRCASEGDHTVSGRYGARTGCDRTGSVLRSNSGSFTWILTVPCFQKSAFCDGERHAEAGSRDRGWKVNYECVAKTHTSLTWAALGWFQSIYGMGNMGNLSENMGIFWDLRGFNHIPGFVSSVFWLNVLNGKSAMTGEWITGSFGHAADTAPLEGLPILRCAF